MRLLAAMATCSSAAHPAAAEQLFGSLSVQYQQVEQNVRFLDADSTLRDTRVKREFFLQNYELNYTAQFTPRLNLLTQLRFTNLDYLNSPQAERTPYGSVRLIHPAYGLTASYRPITTVSTLDLGGGDAPGDTSVAELEITSRRREATVFAYLAPQRLPRLDLTWIRRSVEDGLTGRKTTGLDRNARLSYSAGPLSLRGGYGTLARKLPTDAAAQTFQKSYDGGASLRAISRPDRSLLFDYQFTGYERGTVGSRQDRTRSHAASVSGNLRPSAVTNWTLYYGYRRSDLRGQAETDLQDHNGNLLFNYAPTRALSFSAGGGVHTVRLEQQEDLRWSLTAIASAQGPVRPGWLGVAGLTHTTNWEPGKQRFNIETARAGSEFLLARGLKANLDLQAIVNGDTAARQNRVVLQPSAGVTANPLSGIYVDYSWRLYRSGPDLGTSTSRSASDRLEVRWMPLRTLELTGSVGHTGNLPDNDPRSTVRAATLRWTPSAGFQFNTGFVKSTQERSFAVANQLSGRDLFTARLLARLSRSFTLDTGISLADRGLPTESTQLDAAVTWTFGR